MKPDHWRALELRHLVALQAIAKEGTFWAAADRLDVSTSALSQQIATLEAAAGHRLIERSRGKRRVTLTEPGRLLLPHAEAIAARVRAARADLAAFGEGGVGSLSVGTFQSVGAKIVPSVLRRFATDWPKIELRLVEGGAELLDDVARGEVDLAFATLPLPDGPYAGVELIRDPHVLAVPRGDPDLARARRAGFADLVGRRLVGFKPSRSTMLLEDELRLHGVEPNIVFRSDDNAIVQGMVAAGIGSALVPLLALEQDDPALRIIELPEVPPRVVAIVWHRDRYRSPAALAFVERAKEVCRSLAPLRIARGRR